MGFSLVPSDMHTSTTLAKSQKNYNENNNIV